MNLFLKKGKLEKDELCKIEEFFLLKKWAKDIGLVIYMHSTAEKALEREYKDLLTDIPLDTTGKYIQNKKRINPFDLFDKQKTTFYPRYPSHINYLQTISSDTK